MLELSTVPEGPEPHGVVAHPRPFRREVIWGRIGPFVIAGAFTVAVLPFQELDTRSPLLWIACALTPLITILAVVLPWDRWPASAQAVLPLTLLLIVALLRDASGATNSVYAPLTLLTTLWLALYGTARELAISIVCLEAIFIIPYLIEGPPRYPVQDVSEGLLYCVLGTIVGFAIQRLIRGLEHSTSEFRRLSRTDPLTGVANRRVWEERLQLELTRSSRSSEPVSLALVDLDNFKQLNDSKGHEAGDQLLRSMTTAWSSALSGEDLLARFGGDEFGLLLCGCELADALLLIERLKGLLPGESTCSAGVVQWDGMESFEELVRRGDNSLYRAKQLGRDRIESGLPAE
jgi:diguanylate cyclase (GGDEF)-like protein